MVNGHIDIWENNMKVGISGLGFIGSTLANSLLREDIEVVGMDNRFKENLDNIIPFITNQRFKFILGDITKDEDVKRFYDQDLDYVVHSAALVGFPICDRYPDLAYSVNVKGTENMIKYKPDSVRILYTSTGSVYRPGQESCDEASDVDPPSWYGKTKLMAENIVLGTKNGLVHRYATACGVGFSTLRVNLLANDLVYRAVNEKCISIFEGSFRRVFINVEDLVNAILQTLYNFEKLLKDDNRIYNVGNNDMSYTKLELAKLIQEKTNCHIVEVQSFQDKDKRDYGYDSTKFMNATYWKPRVNMEQTIIDLIKVCGILTPFSRYN